MNLIGQEEKAKHILQGLVRINTSNKDAEEYQAAIYIQQLLKNTPIEAEIIYSPNKRANLVASIKADLPTKEPLVLLSHLDVVAPGEQQWANPPFSGKEADGCIWGRGTLDTKQLTVMHLMSLLNLSEKKELLNRDVYLISTADEENGSKEGMDFLAKERSELFEGAIVLSEGGGFTVATDNERFMLFASGEKGNALVKITAEGEGGHAGSPPTDQAIHHISQTLQKLFQIEKDTGSYPVLQRFESLLHDLLQSEETMEIIPFLPKLHEYMKYETCIVNEINIGEKLNVIPYKGEVFIEFRTLPSETEKTFVEKLQKTLKGEKVQWEIVQFQHGYESDIEHEVIQLFKKYSPANGFRGEWVPFTALGKTDGRFISALAKNIYGLSPVTISFSDVLSRVHQVDERIELDAFYYGVHLMRDVVHEFCINKES